MTGEIEQQMNDTLGRWGSWVARGNTRHGLGVRIAAYAERIGAGSWGDSAESVGEDVLEIDRIISGKLHPPLVAILHLHYAVPGPVKSKTRSDDTRGYYAQLNVAKACLAWLIREQK